MRAPFLLALALGMTAGGAHAQPAEMVLHSELRVCADPNNMPWTNKAQEGFENEIATVIGADLKEPVSYFWFPMVSSFIRKTLGARQCDLVMGEVGGGPVDDTNPYYHTAYQIVTRAEDGITARSVADPALAAKRFGLIAATPPTDLLLKHGLLGMTDSYSSATDTKFSTPARQMIQDLLDKKIDVALLWGPIAGYTIKREHLPLHAEFLEAEPGSPRLDYRISMSVRAGEPEWRRRINAAIVRHQDEITAILQHDGVPLLDDQNHPIPAPVSATPDVPQPEGYRLDNYNAPVPAAAPGAQTIHTEALHALVMGKTPPVLVDVLPAPRRPPGMRPDAPWLPVPRRDIPGSLWLPDIGRGAIPPERDAWMEQQLNTATGGDRSRAIAFYCRADCWMSWNAAKRAAAHGWKSVLWYPDGAEAWEAAGFALADAVPVK